MLHSNPAFVAEDRVSVYSREQAGIQGISLYTMLCIPPVDISFKDWDADGWRCTVSKNV